MPRAHPFNSFIPWVNGKKFAKLWILLGNIENGIVAPYKNNIGKYTSVQTKLVFLTLLQTLSINIPNPYMEINTKKYDKINFPIDTIIE